ncbi:MAG TPA: DMT family protein [Hanamia sp.]
MNKVVGVSIFLVILMSWGIEFFEYLFQVPANRIGLMKMVAVFRYGN